MNRVGKRFLSMLLALVMVIGMISTTSLAAESTSTGSAEAATVVYQYDGTDIDPDDYVSATKYDDMDILVRLTAGIAITDGNAIGEIQIAFDADTYTVVKFLNTWKYNYDLSNLTDTELKGLMNAVADSGLGGDALAEATGYIDNLVDTLNTFLIDMNVCTGSTCSNHADHMKCSIVEEDLVSVGVGIYALAAIVSPADSEKETLMDYGYLIITPDLREITIAGEGDEGNIFLRTYNGQPQEIEVSVSGSGTLKYKYVGLDTTADRYYSNEAPTDAGVYAVVAAYMERDDITGMVEAFGGGAKILVIAPAQANFALEENTVVTYDGQEHFAKVKTNDKNYSYVSVTRSEDGKELFVKLPDNVDKIVSLIPSSNISNKVAEALEAAAANGDAQMSTIQNKLNNYLDKVINLDLSGEIKNAAKVAYAEAENALDNAVIDDTYRSMIEKMVDKVNAMVESNAGENAEAFIAADVIAEVMASYDVGINNINYYDIQALMLTKAEELGYVQDATTLLNTLAAIVGVENKTEVKDQILDVKTEFEAVIKDVAKDVTAAVKTLDAEEVMNAVDTALSDIETYIDETVLTTAKDILFHEDIASDITIYFEKNPTEVGTYTCYAVNVAANYMPTLATGELEIAPIEIEVTMNDVEVAYDGSFPDPWTFAVSGDLLDGDTLTVVGSTDAPATRPETGGVYTIEGAVTIVDSEGNDVTDGAYYNVTVTDGTLTIKPNPVYVCRIDNKYYTDLSNALAVAKNGETVIVLRDIVDNENTEEVESEQYLVITSGVTLDLAGYSVEAQYVIGLNASHVVDSSETNTGLLKVAKNNVALATTNSEVPVWNGKNGYLFVRINGITTMLKSNNDGSKTLGHVTYFEEIAHEYLAAGRDASRTSVVVRLSWVGDTYTASQDFIYTDSAVKTVVGSYGEKSEGKYGQVYTATFAQVWLESAKNMTAKIMIISDTGVEYSSAELKIGE